MMPLLSKPRGEIAREFAVGESAANLGLRGDKMACAFFRDRVKTSREVSAGEVLAAQPSVPVSVDVVLGAAKVRNRKPPVGDDESGVEVDNCA